MATRKVMNIQLFLIILVFLGGQFGALSRSRRIPIELIIRPDRKQLAKRIESKIVRDISKNLHLDDFEQVFEFAVPGKIHCLKFFKM